MKTVQVLKLGGALAEDPDDLEALAGHVRRILDDGHGVVVVHGGGREIGAYQDRLRIPVHRHRGLRVTCDRTMDLATMVLCGLVNTRIVAALTASGIEALGLTGADLGWLRARFLNRPKLGRVGGPPEAEIDRVRGLLELGLVLVVSPVCLADDGGLANVNADDVAQAVAVALEASCLDFVTDVAAVRDGDRALRRLDPAEIARLIGRAAVRGGMIPKLQASVAALDAGIPRVRVGNLDSLGAGTATVASS